MTNFWNWFKQLWQRKPKKPAKLTYELAEVVQSGFRARYVITCYIGEKTVYKEKFLHRPSKRQISTVLIYLKGKYNTL